MKQECRTCGAIGLTPRCRPCTNAAKAPYHDPAYLRLRAQLIQAEPWCHTVGGCPYPDAGTPANPLTGDHVTPLRVAGPTLGLVILCLRCNSAKGARTGGGSKCG